ncbi:NADPH:quinone oxidoreductase family protein [Paracoccus sp. 1_MG-2023]|uniref:NADPH:quinone oxidoreductase family protein n=1 Tax=unclassified Paracoccus (in: a-proteobacteria) TaxID=2688777 RepID=UPI001C08F02B|nr:MULTISPECIES: NADPH:quinone oxidoreductase family protein [unclassified Paracoccus (in: a-proteobacteria)]MBU2958571.1 NADPH:quinone oxidoreductase family protein [Paracoccus sp. C2R09]MDO6667564.1 NADPH:quinone oxidoreductase family protein [Paracoccus sp. 1_MG-2023]
MIRTAVIEELGQDPVIREVTPPKGHAGQVVVRMIAAALNFADLLKAKGNYQEAENPPYVPGLEGAGVVVSAPPGCGIVAGDRVIVAASGTMAGEVAVDAEFVQQIPDEMSFAEAAGLHVAYGTSHMALSCRARLKSGETLVVLGAAGGVGLTAVEIGHAMGARVIGVARGAERLEAVRRAGADLVIDSAECRDLKAELRGMGGVDVVYDAVGAEPGEAAFGALKRRGRFLLVGFAGGRPPALPLNHALVKNIAIHGLYWNGYRELDPGVIETSMKALFDMYRAGRLHPGSGVTLPLDRIAEGFALLRERRSVGKVIITF